MKAVCFVSFIILHNESLKLISLIFYSKLDLLRFCVKKLSNSKELFSPSTEDLVKIPPKNFCKNGCLKFEKPGIGRLIGTTRCTAHGG